MRTCGFYGLYLHLVAKQEANIIPSRIKSSTPDILDFALPVKDSKELIIKYKAFFLNCFFISVLENLLYSISCMLYRVTRLISQISPVTNEPLREVYQEVITVNVSVGGACAFCLFYSEIVSPGAYIYPIKSICYRYYSYLIYCGEKKVYIFTQLNSHIRALDHPIGALRRNASVVQLLPLLCQTDYTTTFESNASTLPHLLMINFIIFY